MSKKVFFSGSKAEIDGATGYLLQPGWVEIPDAEHAEDLVARRPDCNTKEPVAGRVAEELRAAASGAHATPDLPDIDPAKLGEAAQLAGLRTDGPTLEQWMARGYTARGYPPRGYAAVPSPALDKLRGETTTQPQQQEPPTPPPTAPKPEPKPESRAPKAGRSHHKAK
jgi:hypothetical protein